MSVKAAAAVSQAEVLGASLGSSELTFTPGEVKAGSYVFDIGTAGATALVLQTVYLPLALRGGEPSLLTITGGTHVRAAPCFHFLQTTWNGFLKRMGLTLHLTMRRPGFYPRGGGQIEARITPAAAVRPLHLEAAPASAIGPVVGFSAVAGLPPEIAERQARQAARRLHAEDLNCDLKRETWAGGPGTAIGLELQGPPGPPLFFAIGERGKPAEKVADAAVSELLAHVRAAGGAVDPHSADQILLPLALAAGVSAYPVSQVTRHLLTNRDVILKFVERDVTVEGEEGQPGKVVIR
jgi:RNA 3'-terminal phosphate cyclase (ATP)